MPSPNPAVPSRSTEIHAVSIWNRTGFALHGIAASNIVSTDAHAKDGLLNLRYGLAIARRGWLARREVLNTFDVGGHVLEKKTIPRF